MTWAALLSVSLRLTQLGLSACVNCENNGVASRASLLEATPLFVSTCVSPIVAVYGANDMAP